jgi:hypothetical protein
MKSSINAKNSSKQNLLDEVAELKSQMTENIINLTNRNAELEAEVSRLCLELDEATNGILKRGYLHKWRDREIAFASKWGLRYFILQGHMLSYYLDDKESRPRATINLSNCCIRWEGGKKLDQYHVFSIYTSLDATADNNINNTKNIPILTNSTGTDSVSLEGSLILRVSSESKVEAQMWVEMLEQACKVSREIQQNTTNSIKNSLLSSSDDDNQYVTIDQSPTKSNGKNSISRSSSNVEQLNASASPTKVSLLIRKNVSKQQLSRSISQSLTEALSSSTTPNVSSKQQSNTTTTTSAVTTVARKPSHIDHPFPASRPIHLGARSSPLSSDVRQGEQNYRGFFNLAAIIMC